MSSQPLLPLGFRYSAISAGIRKDGRIDVALIAAERPATVAALFTRNLVRAAPVLVAAERAARGLASAVLVNSGNANACTGEPGLAAARDTSAAVARALGVAPEQVLPASTGVIGALLPAAKICDKAEALVAALSPAAHEDFAQAICTTDRWKKVASRRIGDAATGPVVLAMAKGAGMIHPDLGLLRPGTEQVAGVPHATMLAFLLTDAQVSRETLERALIAATNVTFNACSVDGDTSTNDTVIAMASGANSTAVTEAALTVALTEVCDELARSMARDGEGAEHLAVIEVRGLADDAAARQIAKTVATSSLVKTALFGQDANWGRLLAAAGRAGVAFDPSRARISIGNERIVHDGLAVGAEAEARAAKVLAADSYVVRLELGDGPGVAHYYTCDFGHGYVDVNAGYRS